MTDIRWLGSRVAQRPEIVEFDGRNWEAEARKLS